MAAPTHNEQGMPIVYATLGSSVATVPDGVTIFLLFLSVIPDNVLCMAALCPKNISAPVDFPPLGNPPYFYERFMAPPVEQTAAGTKGKERSRTKQQQSNLPVDRDPHATESDHDEDENADGNEDKEDFAEEPRTSFILDFGDLAPSGMGVEVFDGKFLDAVGLIQVVTHQSRRVCACTLRRLEEQELIDSSVITTGNMSGEFFLLISN